MAYKSPKIHRTPEYRAKAAFQNMKRRCSDGNGKEPCYSGVSVNMSKEEWLDWAVPRYRNFIQNTPSKTPTVHRLNDSGDYEIANIEIISRSENLERQKTKARYLQMVCPVCGETFVRRYNQTPFGKGEDRRHTTCSQSCGSTAAHLDSKSLEESFDILKDFYE